MHDHLSDAMNEIRDQYIEEAAFVRRRSRKPIWIGALAAMLALVLIVAGIPTGPSVTVLAAAGTPGAAPRAYQIPESAAPGDFFSRITSCVLADTEENTLCSPANIYLSLAMLAEVTGGETQAEILEAAGSPDLPSLRDSAAGLWHQVYRDSDQSVGLLANSLWLDEGTPYHQAPLDQLAGTYYASSYSCDLGSKDAGKALNRWLSRQTGGTLESVDVDPDPDTVLALASTVYFRAVWTEEFSASRNTREPFHGAAGDRTVTYMNSRERNLPYFRGDRFGAVSLPLRGGSQLWLLLPDEGVTPGQLLDDPQAAALLAGHGDESRIQSVKVNLTMPKFDFSASFNLKQDLEALGIHEVFTDSADFSPLLPQPASLSQVAHAARITVDEEGVTAAAFTVEACAGEVLPPETAIDFRLDRPFLFGLTAGAPLFTGVVHNP